VLCCALVCSADKIFSCGCASITTVLLLSWAGEN
jgi:hypothetical protein